MKKKKWICLLLSALLGLGTAFPQQSKESPVEKVKKIGDKLIRETPFAYKLGLASCSTSFNTLNFVDFGRTFGLGQEAVAYAYTQLSFPRDTTIRVETEHNDACKIWCNGQLIYENKGKRDIKINRGERSMKMTSSFLLPLKSGNNDVLIKSATFGKEWCVFLQPPSDNDAVLSTARSYPQIGLTNLNRVDKQVSDLTNWLIIGPFQGGIDVVHEPEQEFKFGYMYKGLHGPVTWTIPKIEVLGEMIDPEVWGTTYQWNYHNGGVAWAMQQLGELTGAHKYTKWATDFCDYQMEGMPFVDYQVNDLRAYNSANAMVINSTLLDFTLAPSLPILYVYVRTRILRIGRFIRHT